VTEPAHYVSFPKIVALPLQGESTTHWAPGADLRVEISVLNSGESLKDYPSVSLKSLDSRSVVGVGAHRISHLAKRKKLGRFCERRSDITRERNKCQSSVLSYILTNSESSSILKNGSRDNFIGLSFSQLNPTTSSSIIASASQSSMLALTEKDARAGKGKDDE
jgi:hypothetical protein